MPEGKVGQVLYFDVICEPAPSIVEWLDDQAPDEYTVQEAQIAYRRYLVQRQPWRSVLIVEGNREQLFRSSERYLTEEACRAAGHMAFAPEATVFERRAEHGLNLMRRGREATPEEQQT